MKILVLGETCKDIFIYGDSTRVCPESSAQVFVGLTQTYNFGMASNTFSNIKSILDRKYHKDHDEVVLKTNHFTKEHITKTRYVLERTNTTLLRVDVGDKNYGNIFDIWNGNYADLLNSYDCVVISDYNKGFITEDNIDFIANHRPVFLDTKKVLGDWCNDVKFLKLNQEEYEKSKSYILANPHIKEKLIITLGSQGACYKDIIYPVKKVSVKGISGAGDTFWAGFVVSYIKHQDVIRAIKFGNKMATIVVQKSAVSVPYEGE